MKTAILVIGCLALFGCNQVPHSDILYGDPRSGHFTQASEIFPPAPLPTLVGNFALIAFSRSSGSIAGIQYSGYFGDAELLAQRRCGYRDCRVIVWKDRGCVAVATAPYQPYLGAYAFASSQNEAGALATALCRQTTSPCALRALVCS